MPVHKATVAALYRRHSGELVRFLARRLSCRDLAADLVQELFLRLLARDGSVAAVRHERGFLFTSARHLMVEAQRSPRWRETAEAEAEVPSADLEPSAEECYLDQEAVTRLLEVVAGLPPRCREAFLLHKFDGLSYPEVASRLGISVSMVEKHLMRALDACRAHLD